jgi:hypothetical protein
MLLLGSTDEIKDLINNLKLSDLYIDYFVNWMNLDTTGKKVPITHSAELK